MKQRTWVITIILIIVFFAGVFAYLNQKAKKQEEVQNARQEAIEQAIKRPEITLNAKYQYIDGVHNFVGTIEVPTPCHTNDVEVVKNQDSTEIAITYNPSEEVCVQIIEERQWVISFEGPKDENIIATLNGEIVNLNIFEVPKGESIEEFEIFNKG